MTRTLTSGQLCTELLFGDLKSAMFSNQNPGGGGETALRKVELGGIGLKIEIR